MLRDIDRAFKTAVAWAMEQLPEWPQQAHTHSSRPVWMTCMSSMRQGPDASLPRELLQGFQVQGLMNKSGSLKPLTPREIAKQKPRTGPYRQMGNYMAKETFGATTEEWISQLEADLTSVATTLDLRKGYKQLFPHPTELRTNFITYAASGVRGYRPSYASLFSAVCSVNHNNRVTPLMNNPRHTAVSWERPTWHLREGIQAARSGTRDRLRIPGEASEGMPDDAGRPTVSHRQQHDHGAQVGPRVHH